MLDRTDIRIIDELFKNSRLTMKELGEKVHLTGPAASARVIKLEDQGVIEGYTINVNHSKLGYAIHAFVTIFTDDISHQPYLTFIKKQGEYIIKNYKISGDGCYILECRFPSNNMLDEFLKELNKHANYKVSIVISS